MSSTRQARRTSRPDRRAPIWSRWLWVAGAAACMLGRSEESVRQEFTSYVNGANQCVDATECATASTDCPLGCSAAVRADRRADVEEKGRRLVAEYERGGQSCAYECPVQGPPLCLGGRCTFGYAEPPPGTGGASSGTGGSSATGGQGAGGGAGAVTSTGGTGGPAGGGPIPNAYLTLAPADGSTAALDDVLGLSVSDPAGLLDATAIEALREAAVLETWPEKIPVPAVATVDGAGGSSGVTIRLTPSGVLADRWYAVTVASLPAELTATLRLLEGSAVARFQPFSHPRVEAIDVCEKSPPGSKLIVSFSEPVAYPADVSTLVSLAIAGLTSPCEVDDAGPSALHLRCAELTSSSHATITVGAGLQGATMVPLAPVAFDVDVAALPAGSCRTFHPPLP